MKSEFTGLSVPKRVKVSYSQEDVSVALICGLLSESYSLSAINYIYYLVVDRSVRIAILDISNSAHTHAHSISLFPNLAIFGA